MDQGGYGMPLTVEQFITRLSSSKLMGAAEIQQFLESQGETGQTSDVHDLARRLVQQEILTMFQANALITGKTQKLVLGGYILVDRIGCGAMGEVFRAYHRETQQRAALKVLPSKAMTSQETVQRFHREMTIAAKLTHANIVACLGSGEDEGTHYIALEYVDGADLSKVIKAQSTLAVAKAADIILQAAKGLEHAHQRGVIHRDIKPSNLMLDNNGIVKVLDLGLARMLESGVTPLTHSGNVMGTIDYMAPEQAFDSKHADHRADIYGLGCTFYFLLTGKPVYEAPTLIRKALAHRDNPIPSLREISTQVTENIDMVFQKMVAKTPRERFQSMGEVVVALEACGVRATKPPPKSAEKALGKLADKALGKPAEKAAGKPPEPAAKSMMASSLGKASSEPKTPGPPSMTNMGRPSLPSVAPPSAHGASHSGPQGTVTPTKAAAPTFQTTPSSAEDTPPPASPNTPTPNQASRGAPRADAANESILGIQVEDLAQAQQTLGTGRLLLMAGLVLGLLAVVAAAMFSYF